MPTEELEADYVIVGAGASAMSFTDVILAHSDRSVIMVDRHAQPGGHWNHAYSFVRLHQPSAFYGVDSRQLGRDVRDTDGSNAGLFELATGRQVLTYFDEVMREQFLPTGRVTFLPMSEWLPDGTAVSQLTGRWTRLKARRRVVDARYIGSEIPSLHTPKFTVDPRVPFVPINGLTSLSDSPSGYVVVGGGKTGSVLATSGSSTASGCSLTRSSSPRSLTSSRQAPRHGTPTILSRGWSRRSCCCGRILTAGRPCSVGRRPRQRRFRSFVGSSASSGSAM